MIDEIMEKLPGVTREEIQLNVYVCNWYRENINYFWFEHHQGIDIQANLCLFCADIVAGKYKELI